MLKRENKIENQKKKIYLAAPGLSWGTQGLLVVAHKLFVVTCGIRFPDQGLKPGH